MAVSPSPSPGSSDPANVSPVETQNENDRNTTALWVKGEVSDLTSKVQTLQNAYEEYLDAERVDVFVLDNSRMSHLLWRSRLILSATT